MHDDQTLFDSTVTGNQYYKSYQLKVDNILTEKVTCLQPG